LGQHLRADQDIGAVLTEVLQQHIGARLFGG